MKIICKRKAASQLELWVAETVAGRSKWMPMICKRKAQLNAKIGPLFPHQSLSTSPVVLAPLPLHPSSCYFLGFWPPCCHLRALFPPTKVCVPFSLQNRLSDTLSQLFTLLLYVPISCGHIYWSQSVLGTSLPPLGLLWVLFWLCTRYVSSF